MDADEIISLNPDSVHMLLESRQARRRSKTEECRRQVERWPFPGTTQVWITEGADKEKMVIGTCTDVSRAGMGLRVDEPLPMGETVAIAIHQPEASYHGRAIVRHCTSRRKTFFVGLQFIFD